MLPVLVLLCRKIREAGTRTLELEGWSRLHRSARDAELSDIQVQLCRYSPDAHTAEMWVRISLRTPTSCTHLNHPFFPELCSCNMGGECVCVWGVLKPLLFWWYIVVSFCLLLNSVTDWVFCLLMRLEAIRSLLPATLENTALLPLLSC